ncbi:MAG: undecaprenyl-phosphate galactose phosphotransferase WbaP [Anaerolineales bacterium]|nr:undecaprenyl-phosphate galactose phosphotransferase WbaP [Anaerolineales bacterium]
MRNSVLRSIALTALLMIGDILGVFFCFAAAFLFRSWTEYPTPLLHEIDTYSRVWPLIFLWPITFALAGLYPGYWLNASRRLQKIVISSTSAALLFMSFTFLTKTGEEFSRLIFTGTWLFSLVVLPMLRNGLRVMLGRAGFHGPELVMLGGGRTAELVLSHLNDLAIPPVKTVAIFDDDPDKIGTELYGIPIVGPVSDAAAWARKNHLRQILISIPGLPGNKIIPIVESLSQTFFRVLLIPDLFGISSHDTDSREIGDMLALDVKRNLLLRRSRLAKRALDLLFSLGFGILVFPIFLLSSLLVLIESGFPIFYFQQRLGLHGKPFRMIKFRTMVSNADQVLEDEIMRNTALQIEWKENQKLKVDPRLTRVGRLLRRFSLDELPQLWNIIRGEMSLIGPRPIIEEEIERYGERIELYYQVRPGLTGLWQVSGRSALSYEERMRLDMYYVRNWSIWLDLVILFRTIGAVLSGRGAY